MADNEIEVTCECGFKSRGPTDEVVAETQKHGHEVHNMDVSKDQVLAMAHPAPSTT